MTDTAALLRYVPLVGALAWAAAGDVRARRIRNALTLPLIAVGLAQAALASAATVTPGHAVLGLLVGFGLTFVLFAMRALGGGDVKLMAGVGAWVGPRQVLFIFLATAVVGMVIVLAQAVWQRRIGRLLRNTAVVAANLANVGEVGVEQAADTGLACRTVDKPLPYAVPVLVATVLVLATAARGGLL